MDYNLILQKVSEFTDKFITAAMPVAKKAYEIGLLTLQIDALSVLVPALIVLLASGYVWYKVVKFLKNSNAWDSYPQIVIPMGMVGWIPPAWSAITLLNIWIWVKLFKPELWLAHQAIETVLHMGAK